MQRKPGHLFVVHADLTKLSCDGVLIPCDGNQAVSYWWFDLFAVRPRTSTGWEPLPSGAGLREGAGPRHFELADTVSLGDDLNRLTEVVVAGLRALAERSEQAHEGRDLPLIALPLPGTGHGNFAHRRGAVVQHLVPALVEAAADLGVDIALVMRDKRDYAAVQTTRDELKDLTAHERAEAGRLGTMAGKGQLSVFVGAGVSVPLGLPSWWALINKLRAEAKLEAVPDGASDTDLKRAASEAARCLGDSYAQRVAHAVRVEHHALSHGLLAGLRAGQSVTTNFDVALELAMAATHGPELKVIAKDWATADAPWLLKLHGTAGDPQGVVLTEEEYERHAKNGRPLYAMVQGLLMTSHLLFVGFSLTDSAYLDLAEPVAEIYRKADAGHAKVATALGLRSLAKESRALDEAFHHLHFTDRDIADSSGAARQLEIFLDGVALTAARARGGAHEYLLDRRYDDLVEQQGATPLRVAMEELEAEGRSRSGAAHMRVLESLKEFGAHP